ncbi:MAG: 4Fe-4S dicluster domain-containing protein [Deltaproteobacteria bacterium]|nr:4Fe-4S dicluster domain-containing protein [Deltaproteobacteria bacterium]
MSDREHPLDADEATGPLPGLSRRRFLELMGAAMALRGAGGCGRPPDRRIVTWARQPEEVVPGRPLYFASAFVDGGYGQGVLVESHTGRPTKVEGNPDHPASLGAASALGQASVLEVYDPTRTPSPVRGGEPDTWDRWYAEVRAAMARDPAGVRVLTGTVTSPSLAAGLRQLLADLPGARWDAFDPLHPDGAFAGARLATGRTLQAHLRPGRARVVVSLGADFLAEGPGHLRHAREVADARRARLQTRGREAGLRLYAIETALSVTGAFADHRLALPPSLVGAAVSALARRLGLDPGAADDPALAPHAAWLDAMAADLRRAGADALVVAGDGLPPELRGLAFAMNERLGAVGRTMRWSEPLEMSPLDHQASLLRLVGEMKRGEVSTLVILGENPVYATPGALDFAGALARVPLSTHVGLFADETAARCTWHLPLAHPLEAWGDVRGDEGTLTPLQPLIAPLDQGRSALEVVAMLAGEPAPSGYELLRRRWREGGLCAAEGGDFEAGWRRALHDGRVQGSEAPAVAARAELTPELRAALSGTGAAETGGGGLELSFRPDPHLRDGRYARNAWLQELPRPLTGLTWGNAALLSPADAARLGVGDGSRLEVGLDGRSVTVACLVQPGHADGAMTLTLGHGRTHAGPVGTAVGQDVGPLRGASLYAAGATVRALEGRWPLARPQEHHHQGERELLRVESLSHLRERPAPPGSHPAPHEHASLHADRLGPPERPVGGAPEEPAAQAWAMVIDLAACIGCGACSVACQAENNIPVVGKEQVQLGRIMQWMRIDRYELEDTAELGAETRDGPLVHNQPVPCMHCEQAPCEVVCPVGATTHSSDGLNEMTYNRCVGTRYCSNACPYKVRRFNYLDWHDLTPTDPFPAPQSPRLALQRNPNVSVRSRGVMEKCTWCVQRIREAQIEAGTERRPLRDGDVRTACQQTCPTQAIAFGDLNEPDSQVVRLRAEPHHYAMMAELGTRPRTTYLAALRDLNPAMPPVTAGREASDGD